MSHLEADIRSREARHWLAGVDILYHLGFQLWAATPKATADMEQVNVDGTANLLAVGPVGHIVLASSAAVYGAWPDNPLPLRERDVPRPNPQCGYAAQKLAAEALCSDASPTTTLRVCAVLGPSADRRVSRAVHGYRLAVPEIRHVPQALQFLHEDDAVDAFCAAGRLQPTGWFNIATEDWLDARGVAALSGGRVIGVGRSLMFAASELGRRTRLSPFGVDRAVLLNGPLALDPTSAARGLAWKPLKPSSEVLVSAICGWSKRTKQNRAEQTG